MSTTALMGGNTMGVGFFQHCQIFLSGALSIVDCFYPMSGLLLFLIGDYAKGDSNQPHCVPIIR